MASNIDILAAPTVIEASISSNKSKPPKIKASLYLYFLSPNDIYSSPFHSNASG
jgi:hypothetical protein